MPTYRMTPPEVARRLASGEAVPLSELPLIGSEISSRTFRLSDPVAVEFGFAERYGIGRRYRSIGTLAQHLGCPQAGNVLEWLVREVRILGEKQPN